MRSAASGGCPDAVLICENAANRRNFLNKMRLIGLKKAGLVL